MIIDNQDNEPLTIDTIQLKGYTYELITRFTKPATYYLTYGNNKAHQPSYDLQYVSERVPKELKILQVGIEEPIQQKEVEATESLLKNKIWLWAVMLIVILLLGGFTFSMMKKK
ncbi:hypothetical protein [Aquimarina sp. 2201CG14-23]|uniref:hypothetical protein n=1 Tax=Aquimarina mycalae TaxID=3040073 RepID=UPI0024781C23|nr:hypothetical protein [Aquimarina sp. 2201CG14-23]MDH7444361.1 hypothetical protein [Aquimarina sp. 2201CG14-23]